MCPIYALYAAYMAHILSARAPANRVPKSISLFDDACIKGFFFLPLEAKEGLIHSFLEKMRDFMHFFKKITG